MISKLFSILLFCAIFSTSNSRASEPVQNVWGQIPRILIFSPHPDDDILGSAAMMKAITVMKTQGIAAEIRIVYMTCGDAYIESLDQMKKEGLAQTYLDLGKMRHQEALASVADMGVPPTQTTFLGFPDQGMDTLYTSTTSTPYQSDYTHVARVPYDFAFHPGEPFTHDTVLNDLVAIITEFKPTVVFSPTLTDQHPDHHATREFITLALQQMHSSVLHLEYLIHWEAKDSNWPGQSNNWLAPAGHIAADYTLLLSTYGLTQDQKIQAINRHYSQTQIEGDYLRGFAKTTEQFWNTHSAVEDYLIKP